ncbi:MAG: calcium-binding protein [Rhodobacteraceae bacterium]|nr:calcium-binding protein [Paracoccaceae bacterium]
MANVILTSQTTTFVGTLGDHYYLPQGETISAIIGDAFSDPAYEPGSGMHLINDGTFISLDDDGVEIADFSSTVINGINGIIRGQDSGIALTGTSTTTVNFGEISGNDEGVRFETATNGNSLTNYGMIFGGDRGIEVAEGGGHYIANGGTITGNEGFYISGTRTGFFELNNSGTISGAQGSGIKIQSDGSRFKINNSGEISGNDSSSDTNLAISSQYTASGATALDIVNSGQIIGGVFSNFAEVNLDNTGTITGDVDSGGSADKVINSGLISGDIDLGGGGDTLKLKEGGEVFGAVTGGNGNDEMTGNSGDNEFSGGNNNDVLRGKAGDDTLYGDSGGDDLRGGKDEDVLDGGAGTDNLYGGSGDDILFGGNSNDNLNGGKGDDELFGGNSDDTLDGGKGDDTLTGDDGTDTFVFGLKSDNDVITDFIDGSDQIDLTAYNLSGRGDLVAAGAFTDTALGAVIDLSLVGGTGTITVTGMLVADLNNSEFVF